MTMSAAAAASPHSLFTFLTRVLTQAVYRQATRNSHREWQYHRLDVYNCILLKMSTWGSKHIEENNILWINNYQCIVLVIGMWSIHDARSEKYQVMLVSVTTESLKRETLPEACTKLYIGAQYDLMWSWLDWL